MGNQNDNKKMSFVMYEDWMNIILSLPDKESLDLVRTVFSYCLGKEYEGSPVSNGLLATMKPTIDADVAKYKRVREKNLENIMKRWHKEESGIQQNTVVYGGIQPNTNVIRSNTKSVDIDIDRDIDRDIPSDKGLKKKDDKSSQKEGRIPKADLDEIVSRWNTLPDPVPKITVLKTGTKRYESLAARYDEYGVDNIMIAIEKVRKSSFLCGKSSSWHISFDWFVLPNNFPKVLEGNYTDSEQDQRPKSKGSLIDEWRQKGLL